MDKYLGGKLWCDFRIMRDGQMRQERRRKGKERAWLETCLF
jgi:hypothetical protein